MMLYLFIWKSWENWKNSGYSALTLWRYKNGLERHENGYQLWLNSYEAFISLYFFSMCTNTHLTEDIMLKYRRISRNLIQKNLFSEWCICKSTGKIPNKASNWYAKWTHSKNTWKPELRMGCWRKDIIIGFFWAILCFYSYVQHE